MRRMQHFASPFAAVAAVAAVAAADDSGAAGGDSVRIC